jgi:DNA-directed RNA polymerase subunit RPC12/RpoP
MTTLFAILYIVWFGIGIVVLVMLPPEYNQWGGLVLVAGIIPLGILDHIYLWKNYHYICARCHKPFKPTFIRSMFAINLINKRSMKCPHCDNWGLMKALKDEMRVPRGNL